MSMSRMLSSKGVVVVEDVEVELVDSVPVPQIRCLLMRHHR